MRTTLGQMLPAKKQVNVRASAQPAFPAATRVQQYGRPAFGCAMHITGGKVAPPAHTQDPVRTCRRLSAAIQAAGNDKTATETCQVSGCGTGVHAHGSLAACTTAAGQIGARGNNQRRAARPAGPHGPPQHRRKPSAEGCRTTGGIGEQQKRSLPPLEAFQMQNSGPAGRMYRHAGQRGRVVGNHASTMKQTGKAPQAQPFPHFRVTKIACVNRQAGPVRSGHGATFPPGSHHAVPVSEPPAGRHSPRH